jgi:hypothetical protein
MNKLSIGLSLIWLLAGSPISPAAEEAQVAQKAGASLSIEQQLFNDFAARLEQHLHKTAALLAKIRQTDDPQERQKLMKEYAQAQKTTAKITQAMDSLSASGGMMMMGGRKMSGAMMGGGMKCGCGMMKQHAGDQTAAQSGGHEGHDAGASAPEKEGTGDDSDEAKQEATGHEGHQ